MSSTFTIDAPEHFLCPITQSIMIHPVTDANSGQNFERKDLLQWIYFGPGTNPLTRAPLHPSKLVENKKLKEEIEQWKAINGVEDELEEEEESSEFFVASMAKKSVRHTASLLRKQPETKDKIHGLAARVLQKRDARVEDFMRKRSAQAA